MSRDIASHRLHAELIGQPGSRDWLNTPALILDLAAFERNVARMADFARKHGLARASMAWPCDRTPNRIRAPTSRARRSRQARWGCVAPSWARPRRSPPVGSCIFMDREYAECDLDGGGAMPFETALLVDARVISANAIGLITIDAGLKAFATDAGPATIIAGAGDDARYQFMGDEHGAVMGTDLPGLGARITLGTPHCDPTVNLYDAYHVINGEDLAAIWPVTARGRSA